MRLLIILALGLSLNANAQSIDVTFDGLKDLLVQGNARTKGAQLELDAARVREGSLGRSFLPSLQLHAGQENFKTGDDPQRSQPTLGAEARVNLFNGGRDKLESEIRKLNRESKVAGHQRTLSEELQEARRIFWQIMYMQEQSQLLDGMVTVNGQNLNAAGKRIRSGVATESDRVEFEMKAVDLKRDQAEIRLNLAAAKRQLVITLGLPAQTELRFPKEMAHSHDIEDVVQHEHGDHGFLFKEYELFGKRSDLAASSQKRVWWPKVDAYAAYNQYNQRIEEAGPDSVSRMRNESLVGLRVTLNLSSGFEANREAAALAKEAQAASQIAKFKREEVDAHVETEVAELRFLHDQVHDAEANITRAEKYYKMTQSEYARGVKNSPDVLGASERLLATKIKRIQIIRDFQVAKTHILAKIGR